jgi:hypothetical protein
MFTLYQLARLDVLTAFDDAIVNDTEMTIVCYVNGAIRPWKHYPSMILCAD